MTLLWPWAKLEWRAVCAERCKYGSGRRSASALLTPLKKGRPYKVTVAVVGPDGSALQSLETEVTSNVDQSILPAKALVVGPGYDRNPEVFKDGKAPAHFETAKCAQ